MYEEVPKWPAHSLVVGLLTVHALVGVVDLLLFLRWGSQATVSAEVQRLWHLHPGFLFLAGLLAGHLFLTR